MNRLALSIAAVLLALALAPPRRLPRASRQPQTICFKARRSPPTVRIALKGANGSKVDVGSKVLGVGYVRPFVPNQEVRVWVAKAKKEVLVKRQTIHKVPDKDQGRFKIRSKRLIAGRHLQDPREQGSLAEPGGLLSAESQGGRHLLSRPRPGDAATTPSGSSTICSQEQGYYTSNGSSYGSATQRAVLAFRKTNGMPRTYNATPSIFRTLANGKGASSSSTRAPASTSRRTSRAR